MGVTGGAVPPPTPTPGVGGGALQDAVADSRRVVHCRRGSCMWCDLWSSDAVIYLVKEVPVGRDVLLPSVLGPPSGPRQPARPLRLGPHCSLLTPESAQRVPQPQRRP